MTTSATPENPQPAPAITGLPTLDGIINAGKGILEKIDPAVTPELEAMLDALSTLRLVINPAGGKEVEREQELAAMLAAKDVAGLLAFYNDEPPHPALSRRICANDLALLGSPVAAPAPVDETAKK